MLDSKISVALLLSDFNDLKAIDSTLKNIQKNREGMKITSYFYDDLESFWKATSETVPTIAIVDIKLISQGERLLSEHPAVKAQEMPLVFHYTDQNAALLVSTHLFGEFSTLKRSSDYAPALERILSTISRTTQLNNFIDHLNEKIVKLNETIEQKDKAINALTVRTNSQFAINRYEQMSRELCLELEKLRHKCSFEVALETLFDEVNEINEFTIFELGQNSQKLVNTPSGSNKFRTLPFIWLGQASVNGIELFAQNMASQVVLECLEGNVVSLLIKGKSNRVEKMIFVKVENNDFYNHFDWNLFEAYLNGFYSQKDSSFKDVEHDPKKVASSFEAMSFIDQYLFGQISKESTNEKFDLSLKLVNLDLSALVGIILQKRNNRFFWKNFLNDFVGKFELQSGYSFKYFDFGVNQISFLVDGKSFDNFFDELKEFSNTFSYWKYFENTEGILATMIEPQVKMVPLSAYAYLMNSLDIADSTLKEDSASLNKMNWKGGPLKVDLDM